jgi:hypothetical protein
MSIRFAKVANRGEAIAKCSRYAVSRKFHSQSHVDQHYDAFPLVFQEVTMVLAIAIRDQPLAGVLRAIA